MRFDIFKTFPFLEVYNKTKNKDPKKYWLQFLDVLRFKQIIYKKSSDSNWMRYINFNFMKPRHEGVLSEEIIFDDTIDQALETFNNVIENIIRINFFISKRVEIVCIEKSFYDSYTIYYNITE
jgi:hypothetical protein